ncbi:MAG: DksA/TraR family C4-type zinc finger protein [Xanthomonadaceae bacterium]|jgi:phage/conjugal plasmid C-4 type zinc finger TraR family protein|nr:DksA/TraR family C4-type zinc finger protein [Xanthomonadaceae bacterium]
MATGWAGDNAVNEQIEATIKDGIARARAALPRGPSRERCEDCEAPIPAARREAVPGVRLCVACQGARDAEALTFAGYNRRGSKDSQLR